jgi:hypothetical protein
VRPGLSGATLALVEKCLAKDPSWRFAHAEELLNALERAREGAAVETDLWTTAAAALAPRLRATWPPRIVAGAVCLVWGLVAALLVSRAASHRRAVRASLVEAGRHLAAFRHLDALELLGRMRDDAREGAEEIDALEALLAHAKTARAREEVRSLARSFLLQLSRGAHERCRPLLDPGFVEEYGGSIDGLLGAVSLMLRGVGLERHALRVTHIELGEDGVAMATAEVRRSGRWQVLTPVRMRRTDGRWYLWPQWPLGGAAEAPSD